MSEAWAVLASKGAPETLRAAERKMYVSAGRPKASRCLVQACERTRARPGARGPRSWARGGDTLADARTPAYLTVCRRGEGPELPATQGWDASSWANTAGRAGRRTRRTPTAERPGIRVTPNHPNLAPCFSSSSVTTVIFACPSSGECITRLSTITGTTDHPSSAIFSDAST